MLLKIRHALVEVNNSGEPPSTSNSEPFYCCSKQSAIIINNEFVLTTANLLQRFLLHENTDSSQPHNYGAEFLQLLQQLKLIPPRNIEQQKRNSQQNMILVDSLESLKNLQYLITSDRFNVNRRLQQDRKVFTVREAQFLGLFHSAQIHDQLMKLAWQNEDTPSNHFQIVLASSFLLLTMKSERLQQQTSPHKWQRLLLHIRHYINDIQQSVHTMDDVLVMSSPFGLECFYRTINIGKISNLLDEHGSIFMLSTPLTIGCEGSAVFNNKLRLIGIIISTNFQRYQQNMMPLTLAANLSHLLTEFLRYFDIQIPSMNKIRSLGGLQPSSTVQWENSVVLIDNAGHQGSGTLIKVQQRKYILTCAHVVFQAREDVNCRLRDRHFKAKVLWHNPYFHTAFDIALLKITAPPSTSIHDSDYKRLEVRNEGAKVAVGQRIYNIGYPHFNPLRDSVRDLRPTIFEGRLIKCNPALLISDGTVLCGQSGGPMLDEHGLLVGVCVSNIKWKNHIYPNLNSSVPLAAIIRTIEQFARNEDVGVLSALIAPESVQRMWSLKKPPVIPLSKL